MNANDSLKQEGESYAVEMRTRGESTVSPDNETLRRVHIRYAQGCVDQGMEHVSNEVSTSQYTALNFIPKNLLVQFSKPANW